MAEVNLRSWSEISQASEGLQLNSTAATLEHILARFARLETRLVEHERRVAATLPPLHPEPDPPDGPPLYTATQPPYPPYQPPYQPDRYPPQPTSHQPCYTAGSSPTLHPLPQYPPTCWNPPIQHQQLGLQQYGQPSPHQPSCWDQPDYQPARQPDNGWDQVVQPRYSTFGYHPWQPETAAVFKPFVAPTAAANTATLTLELVVVESLPLSSDAVAAAPPPSSLPTDNTSTMVFGEDVSDGIVPNNAIHNVDATLDVPNDKVLEEIVKNDEESPLVLVEATAEKNMVYEDKNLPQVSILMPLLNRGLGSPTIQKEVMEILFQDGFIMFGWISGGEFIQSSDQAGRRGIGEGRHLTIRCEFDPGGESSPKLLFASLFVLPWFPP